MLTLSRAMSGPSRDLPPGDRQPGRTQRKFVWSSGSASKSAAAPATASGSRRRNLCAGSRVGGAASFRDWLIAEPGGERHQSRFLEHQRQSRGDRREAGFPSTHQKHVGGKAEMTDTMFRVEVTEF
jgi:hypothetical protein